MSMRIHGLGSGVMADRKSNKDRKKPNRLPSDPLRLFSNGEAVVSLQGKGESEQNRSQVAQLTRAMQNAEQASTILEEAQSGLEEVLLQMETLVKRVRETAAEMHADAKLHALAEQFAKAEPQAKDGAVAHGMEETPWLPELLARIDEIAMNTRFGKMRLLDGSLGVSGATAGDGLYFVTASELTRSSPPKGYEVRLMHEPVRATLLGEAPLTKDRIRPGLTLGIVEGGRTASYACKQGDTPQDVLDALARDIRREQLAVIVDRTSDGRLLVQHHRFGAGYRFLVESSEPGLFSGKSGGPQVVDNGRDIVGTLNGESAKGVGQTLIGEQNNRTTAGLCVRYTGLPYTGFTAQLPRRKQSTHDTAMFAGRVIVAQHSLTFHFDDGEKKHLTLRVDSMRPKDLGRSVETASGFLSLADIRVSTPYQARDALRMAEQAQVEAKKTLNRVKHLVDEDLSRLLARLRVKSQNLSASQDFQVPEVMRENVASLSDMIRAESRVALNAQHMPSQRSVIVLLQDEVPGVLPTRMN